MGQTILRSVLGQHELDEILSKRAELNEILRKLLDTDPWGIKITAVEIKAIELPDTMKRAMAKQAEAERERRAKIIAADELKIRELIRKYAVFEGHRVTEATNGMEAVELCRTQNFDLIILGLMMPELDGFSACREIRKICDTADCVKTHLYLFPQIAF